MKPLFKTTVVIWSEYDGTSIDMAMLGREAATGDAYCSRFRSELIADPAADEAWDGTEFFGADAEEAPEGGITAPGGVFVMGTDNDAAIEAQLRGLVGGAHDQEDADGEPDYGSPEERVLNGMRSAHSDGQGDWLSLSIVAEYAGMQDGQAGTVLAGLAGKGQVERKGDRGAIYRLVEGG